MGYSAILTPIDAKLGTACGLPHIEILEADTDEEAIREAKALVKRLNDESRERKLPYRFRLMNVGYNRAVKDYREFSLDP